MCTQPQVQPAVYNLWFIVHVDLWSTTDVKDGKYYVILATRENPDFCHRLPIGIKQIKDQQGHSMAPAASVLTSPPRPCHFLGHTTTSPLSTARSRLWFGIMVQHHNGVSLNSYVAAGVTATGLTLFASTIGEVH